MNDSIKDRGTIKWNSLMLPEHVEALKRLYQEEERKEKPLIDEQQKVEMDTKLQLALNNNLPIQLMYFKDFDQHTVKGKLLAVDLYQGKIKLMDEQRTEVHLEDILDISII